MTVVNECLEEVHEKFMSSIVLLLRLDVRCRDMFVSCIHGYISFESLEPVH